MHIKKNFLFFIICLLMTFLLPNYANAALVFTFEAAKEQNSTVTDVAKVVEGFDSVGGVGTTVGSFSGSYTINSANQYGGANGTKYAFCNDSKPLSLSFPKPVGYFGFWWSAGDEGNKLEITTVDNNGVQQVHNYTTATLRNSGILTPGHYGNPNSSFLGQNSGQAYVFLNFFATDDDSKIKSVTLKGSNFEGDNFTAAVNLQKITGTIVPMTCPSPKVSNATGTACITPATCTASQILDTATNTCKTANPSCEALTSPLATLPIGAECDRTILTSPAACNGKKVTICHFPPGNPGNVHTISISLNALDAHVGKHGDTIWQSGKNCPKLPSDCPALTPTAVSIPTINSQVVKYGTTPITVTGTIGKTSMANGESFRVTINGVVYPWDTAGNSGNIKNNSIVITGTEWVAKITNVLLVGVYNVKADRGTKFGNSFGTVTSTDTTTGELTVIESSCSAGQGFVNNVCTTLPVATVNAQTTTVTTPLITGTMGNSVLGASEGFAVGVNGKTYTNNDGHLKVHSDLTWELQIPNANLIPAGLYDVAVTRDNGLPDTTEDELRIDPICTSTQVLINHLCVDAPTVVSQTTFITKPTITGTVGKTALDASEAFSVTVNGVIYDKNNTNLKINSDLTWTLNIPTALPVGTYNVDVLRAGLVPDPTSGELIIQAAPTVNIPSNTTDKNAATFTGNVGSSTTLTITIGTAVSAASITPVIANGTWSYTAPVLAAGTYPVTVTGNNGTATGTLTVTATVIPTPVPTINTLSPTTDTRPSISGSVGNTALSIIPDEPFTVTVGSTIYNKGNASLVIPSTGTTWTLNIPTALEVGSYPVTVKRNNDSAATASDTLVIIGTNPTVTPPTPNPTNDTTPTISGTFGATDLGASETFTVTVHGVTYTVGDGNLTKGGSSSWTLTIPAANALANGVYEIDAVRNTTLHDATTNELTIAIAPPTVTTQTTFDTTPIISGTIGDVALNTGEAFTVLVNGKTYTNGVDTNLKVTGTTWELTILVEIPGSATPYPVVATRGTTPNATTGTGNLTVTPCVTPKVVNSAGTACIDPIPTIVSQTLDTNLTVTPTIKGTVGEVALGSTETFTVTIKTTPSQVYTHTTPETDLKITGKDWTLIVPKAKAIAAGRYDVEAARNTTAKDATSGELIVNLVCLSTETAVNGACVSTVSLPTVVSFSTDDSTPTITGTTGGGGLVAGETFTVDVNGQTYSSSNGLVVSGSTWSLVIPIANALNAGSYTVEAKRVELTGTGIVTITQCASPKVVNATTGDCLLENPVPTVTPLNTPDKKPTLSGTIGTTPLTNNETFIVTVSGDQGATTYTNGVDTNLKVTGTTWTLLITTELKPGTYDVDAVRQGTHDKTSGELVINDDIEVCIRPTTTGFISRSAFDSAKHDLGKCNADPCHDPVLSSDPADCTPPLPEETALPPSPDSLPDEDPITIKPNEIQTCSDGSILSGSVKQSKMVSIKRARIANATTEGGVFDTGTLAFVPATATGAKVRYGTKIGGAVVLTPYETITRESPLIEVTITPKIKKGQATGVKITGATIEGAYIDLLVDYINEKGEVISASNGIALRGGTTKVSTTKENGTVTLGRITSGMITSGTDAAGNPMRGRITSGLYENDLTDQGAEVLTKGRRTKGKLINATVVNARTTTVKGVTIVDDGIIIEGEMDPTVTTKTFGTVTNAVVTGNVITNSNTCFSSGSVGSRGQLNWKEVVK